VFHKDMMKIKRPASWLTKKVKRGFSGYPLATVAFYGPTADLATKIAVAVIPDEGSQPDLLERWFSEGTDIRHDSFVGEGLGVSPPKPGTFGSGCGWHSRMPPACAILLSHCSR
jgi:hypothetical protein